MRLQNCSGVDRGGRGGGHRWGSSWLQDRLTTGHPSFACKGSVARMLASFCSCYTFIGRLCSRFRACLVSFLTATCQTQSVA
jgi:hypothetical protein